MEKLLALIAWLEVWYSDKYRSASGLVHRRHRAWFSRGRATQGPAIWGRWLLVSKEQSLCLARWILHQASV